VPLVDEFCNGGTKIMRNSPLAISKAIKSINANYKDGENGFETEINLSGNVLEQSILKKELQPFREKSSIYRRIIKSFRKINTNLNRLTDPSFVNLLILFSLC
jgi:hypothetical protein